MFGQAFALLTCPFWDFPNDRLLLRTLQCTTNDKLAYKCKSTKLKQPFALCTATRSYCEYSGALCTHTLDRSMLSYHFGECIVKCNMGVNNITTIPTQKCYTIMVMTRIDSRARLYQVLLMWRNLVAQMISQMFILNKLCSGNLYICFIWMNLTGHIEAWLTEIYYTLDTND